MADGNAMTMVLQSVCELCSNGERRRDNHGIAKHL
jgi:hypothetical protein